MAVTWATDNQKFREALLKTRRVSGRVAENGNTGAEKSGERTNEYNVNPQESSYVNYKRNLNESRRTFSSQGLRGAAQSAQEKAGAFDDEEERRSTARTFATALRKASESKSTAVFQALKLGLQFRRMAKENDTSMFPLMLGVALIIDFGDATVIGFLITFFFKPLMFIFLWGRGAWKVRVTARILLFFDLFPVISALPLTTIALVYVWKKMSDKAQHAKKELKKTERSI